MGWDSDSHILLTAPISIGDLTYATGVSGGDLGTVIKNGTTINKWAKYKAFCHPSAGLMTLSDRRSKNCGLTMYEYGSLNAVFNAGISLPVGAAAWIYDQPTAGQPNEWFRMLDFDGYYTPSIAPLTWEVVPSTSYTLDSPRATKLPDPAPDPIVQADLCGTGGSGKTSGYYYYDLHSLNMGVAIGTGNNAVVDAKTFTGQTDQLLPSSLTSSTQTYQVVFFLTNQSFNWGGSASAGKYYLAPVPHSTWKFVNETGLRAWGEFTSTARTSATIDVWSIGGTRNYFKLQVVRGDYSESYTLNSGSGSITSTAQSYTISTSRAWSSGQAFYLRFYTSNTAYVDTYFTCADPL